MFWKKRDNKKQGNGSSKPNLGISDPSAIKVVIKTDLGNVRTNNEDAACFFRIKDENLIRERGYLLIVADGMGGHQAGEVASNMAVEIISREYYKQGLQTNVEKLLSRAFLTANKNIFELASSNEKYRGMGTTCTAIVVLGNQLYFAHVGDSRAYLLKDKLLTKLTEDHTYVQQLVRNGDISLAEAETHPQRNILTNAMGTKTDMRVDTGNYPGSFDEHDRVMICSDGLYDYMSDDELAETLCIESLEKSADSFIAEAKRRGGKDNITVGLIEKKESNGESNLKLTRDVDLPKITRDVDISHGN
jgi:serine/threonine protein phosphatase PrpC